MVVNPSIGPESAGWRRGLRRDPTAVLFEHADGFSKFIILTRLQGQPPDSPFTAPLRQRLIASIIAAQSDDGSWGGGVYSDFFNGTTKQLTRLGGLGLGLGDEAVSRAVAYIRRHQLDNGAIAEDERNRRPGACRHHFSGNLCVSLDSLEALSAVGLARDPAVSRLVKWICRWQRDSGAWWSPGAAHREFRGAGGEPGCGYWLTAWALNALRANGTKEALGAARKGALFLLERFGEVPGEAWYQTPDEFMWCSVDLKPPPERMSTIVTSCVLASLVGLGFGLEMPEVRAGAERLLELQDADGFWRAGHPRLDGWLTLSVLLALDRLHGPARLEGG